MREDIISLLLTIPEIKISYANPLPALKRPVITHSSDAVSLLREWWDTDLIGLYEQAAVMHLNRANQVIGIHPLSSGGLTGTVVDPRVVFAVGLKALSCFLILAHNHPSGSIRPSSSDISLTQRVKEIGMLHDIKLLDHIILTTDEYYSFADEGAL